MKILMISPQPFFTPRGTPFSVYYRAKALGEMGHSVDIVTYHLGRDVRLQGVRIFRILSFPFITHVKIGPSGKKLFLDIFLFWKSLLLLVRGKYDVIHAHEEAIFFCLIYQLLFPKIKIIYDMHSSLPQQLTNFDFTKNQWLIGLFQWLERRALAISDAIITICPELQDIVQDLNLKTPSVMIENSLFDEILYSEQQDEIPQDMINWERFQGRTLIVYTGTFEPYQGIPLLLDSIPPIVAKYPNVLFVLIGGRPEQVTAFRQMAVEKKIKPYVVFTGYLHPNTVKRFMRSADILVSPRTKGNNSPLKLYEYISCGKPIVATNLSTHTQILSSEQAILVDCTPEAFAQGIMDLLKDPARQKILGHKARGLYDSSYGREVYQARLKTVLNSLAAL